MADTSQDDIDSLLGSLEGAPGSDGDSTPGLEGVAQDQPAGTEDTGETPAVQAEESVSASKPGAPTQAPGGSGPSGTPWVDFIPRDTRQKPRTLEERLARAIEDSDAELSEREQLVRDWYIHNRAHNSYYKLWITLGNDAFRTEIGLRRRRAQIAARAAKAARDAQSNQPQSEVTTKASNS
jgi:hypothetical protein